MPITKLTKRCSAVAIALGSLISFNSLMDAAEPIGYVKLNSLQSFVQKVSGISAEVGDPQQAAMIPMMAGMMLGDPGLASPLSTNKITLVILDDFGGDFPPVVGVATIPTDAQARQALEAQGLSIKDYNGKAFVTLNPAYLSDDKALDALISIADAKLATDVELGFWVAKIFENKDEIIDSVLESATNDGTLTTAEQKQNVRAVLDVVFEEFKEIDSSQIGINLSSESIQIQHVLNAVAGSDLAKIFSTKTGGSIPEAKFVAASGWLSATSSFDMNVMVEYLEELADELKPNLSDDGKELIDSFLKTSDSWKGYTGTNAFSMGGSMEAPEINQVAKADLSNDDLRDAYKASQALSEMFMTKFASPGQEVTSSTNYDEVEINGQKVLKIDTSITINGENTVTSVYTAVVDGYQVTASTEESYAKTARAIKADEAVESAIGASYSLPAGTFALGSANPAQLVRAGIAATSEKDAETFDANLKGKNLQPVSFSVTNKDSRLIGQVSIPVKTIAEISKATPKPNIEGFEDEIE